MIDLRVDQPYAPEFLCECGDPECLGAADAVKAVVANLVESLPLVQLSTLLKPIMKRAREAACAVVLTCIGAHAQQMQALDEELDLGVSSSIYED